MQKRLVTALAVAGLVLGGTRILAGEVLPTGVTEGDEIAPELVHTICAQGLLVECGSITQQRCTQWHTGQVGGGISAGPAGGGASGSLSTVCASWTTTTTKLYKDKYVYPTRK